MTLNELIELIMATHGEVKILACIREYFASLPDGQEIEEVLTRAVEKAQDQPIFWRSPSSTPPDPNRSILPKSKQSPNP
ncbi:MAG: hypothetical protein KME09_07240 [Pleurocapsa minor HA4230-MV1]|jgi:hypothetical protein|nr:hypothetical protein [Pleurocapsa minor HA4230-MV1]